MKAKTLIVALFLVLLLLCLGCEVSKSKEDIEGYNHKPMDYRPRDLTPRACYVTNVIVIDNCEYIVTAAGRGIVHKANCKNSFHIVVK